MTKQFFSSISTSETDRGRHSVDDRAVAADNLLAIGTDLVTVFADRAGTRYALVTQLARPDAGDAVDAGDR